MEIQENILQMKPRIGRRLVLFPAPLQGHINPMLQLANILHSKGFTITIIHTQFNSPNHSNYPHFTFLPIPDGLSDGKHSASDISNILRLTTYINESCLEPLRDCLAQLISYGNSEGEPVVCLITDSLWYSAQAVADGLKLPRLVLLTISLFSSFLLTAMPLLREKGYFHLSDQDAQSSAPVPELPPLQFKDIPKLLTSDPEAMSDLLAPVLKETKAASGIIWNAFKELEEDAVPRIAQEFSNPGFPIGPFHKYFPASSSSLLTQDQTAISWLDTQARKSVLYVSFGSITGIEETDLLEMAWGLANSKQPFLWVVRTGSVRGSEWIETLPDGLLEKLGGRGRIVKWGPQQEVLAHPATGGFWTHNGWNSTLESICEGVPMICAQSLGDQSTNARYVTDVWKVGVRLESGLERGEIESAIKRLMVDKEGEEMRERMMDLKEKVDLCLKKGGSSYESLESLVKYILSF